MTGTKKPKVSVLMSVYNSEQYLKQAIDSILNQTFKDFEFLIIDDGSSDRSLEIIKAYNDSRIKIIVNEKNLNLANSLNLGMTRASGEYIFRMDADDISLPTRLEKQVKFMDANKDVVLSGGAIRIIGNGKIWRYPLEYEFCSPHLIFANSFAHPTVVMRKKFFWKNNLNYDPNFLRCQDYELWTRVSRLGKIANIEDVVLLYRVDEQSIKKHNTEGQKYPVQIRKKQLWSLGIDFSESEYELHQKISLGEKLTLKELFLAKKWFNKIKLANKEVNIYNKKFNNFLNIKLLKITIKNFIK